MNNLYYNESQYPEKLEIYFSKANIKLGYASALIFFILGLYLFFTLKSGVILCLFPIFISLVSLNSSVKMSKNSNIIQLFISNKHITSKESKVFKWQNISEEKIEEIRSGKSSITHLTFYYNNRKVLINVQNLDFDSFQLETAIKVYRKRFENSISQ
jgi:uncharacterized protein YacL (UPF0231 family)